MSSGVSDQMKLPGNSAKNNEERNIPWSQQVDEASYENLSSPTNDDNTESTKKYGKPVFYNAKRDDSQMLGAWGVNNSGRHISDNLAGNIIRQNKKSDEGKLDNRPNSTFEEKKNINPTASTAPKKTTWASIASQPAKLTCKTTLTASSHKKKGPGMPPPPMVPGKHNLDGNAWDAPNNNPPLVPSPPPPIDISSIDINPDFSSNIGSSDQDARQGKISKGIETTRDDKLNSSNFGRVRNSPNGHTRKNWSTLPLHQNKQTGNVSTGQNRRGDTSGVYNFNRYSERRGYHGVSRADQDHVAFNTRDENSLQSPEQVLNIEALTTESPQAVLDELRDKNNYNPHEIDLERAASARFFVIKSYSEDDIHRSIKYEIWCSTDHGNKKLDDAFKERRKEGGQILLFFSVNGSGHFCGMAQMMTPVDYNSTSRVWSQDKWKGKFKVKWIYVKDVPNTKLRHIRLENNDNKSVTNSRDTQEVPNAKGIEVLQILHSFEHTTSIFDDFYHYEKKQEEEVSSKKSIAQDNLNLPQTQSPSNRQFNRQSDDRDRDREARGVTAQKYFCGNSAASNFRDRNNSHRSGGYYGNFNEQRRFDNNRSFVSGDREADLERENNEYGYRHLQKSDFNRRDDRQLLKHNNREREFNDGYNKADLRFRSGQKEMQKDNEYPSSDRTRGAEY